MYGVTTTDESEDKGEVHDGDDTANERPRRYYVPSGTARGSMVYANGGADDDPDMTGIKMKLRNMCCRKSRQPLPRTRRTSKPRFRYSWRTQRVRQMTPLDDILTTEKYLSVDKVDAGNGEITITTTKAIPGTQPADPVEVVEAAVEANSLTTLTATDNAFKDFVKGDLVEVRTGRGTSVAVTADPADARCGSPHE